MKRILLLALGGLAIIALTMVTMAYFRPKEYTVERSVVTSASSEAVYAILSDLRRFPQWSPWSKYDPGMKTTFSGAQTGVGAVYSWDGNDKVGAGVMTITDVVPNKQVSIKLEFLRPFPSTGLNTWRIADEGHQRKITWTMNGSNDSLVPRIAHLVMDIDKPLGGDFTRGLIALKVIAEVSSPPTPNL